MKKLFLVKSLCLIIGAFLFGCTTTATIHTTSSVIEGKIVSSDASSVNIQTVNGGSHRISSDEITEIDHPGNVAMGIGGALTAYGILNIAVGINQCEVQGGSFCAGVFTPAAVGVGLFVFGTIVYMGSTSAAEQFVASNTLILPQIFVVNDKRFYGASLSLRF